MDRQNMFYFYNLAKNKGNQEINLIYNSIKKSKILRYKFNQAGASLVHGKWQNIAERNERKAKWLERYAMFREWKIFDYY
jgi:hypothetical protein